jgi:hypothetical protein
MGARDAIAKLISGGIRAFHSSPHDFERFDLSKIGTGEGAQAYGHGLYFAENPAVSGQGGQYWNQFHGRMPDSPAKLAAFYNSSMGFDRAKALKHMSEIDPPTHPEALARFNEARKILESGQPVGPRTYEVNIKADPAQMLDWDNPIAKQKAYEALQTHWDNKIGDPDVIAQRLGITPETKGADLYKAVGGLKYDRPATSAAFQEAGIPGIKYLDEGSRNLGGVEDFIVQHGGRDNALAFANDRLAAAKVRGSPEVFDWEKNIKDIQTPITRNYVVFDPANIDILKKYGIAGAAAAPAVGAAMGSTYDQNQYEAQP